MFKQSAKEKEVRHESELKRCLLSKSLVCLQQCSQLWFLAASEFLRNGQQEIERHNFSKGCVFVFLFVPVHFTIYKMYNIWPRRIMGHDSSAGEKKYFGYIWHFCLADYIFHIWAGGVVCLVTPPPPTPPTLQRGVVINFSSVFSMQADWRYGI